MKKYLFFLLTASVLFAFPGEVVKEFKAPGNFPTGLTYDGTFLWAADYKTDKLYKINPEDGHVVKEIPSPGFWPGGLAWDGKALWNVDTKQNKIFKVDPEDGTILFVIDAPTSNCEGLTWDGQTLWTADSKLNRIMKLDIQDGTAVYHFDAPGTFTQGITFDGTYLWASDRIGDELYMIDPEKGEVILVADSPGPYPRGIAYDGEFLWNIDYQNDKIYKVIRKDDEKFRLKDKRHTEVTLTHQVKAFGGGEIKDLNVYFALPENLPQQKVISISYNPSDKQDVTDKWDQKFAHFNYKGVKGGEQIESKVTFAAELYDIRYFIWPDETGSMEDIPEDIRKEYTTDESKFQINQPFIQKKAKELKGDETNPYWIARSIFDYVRNTLEYALEGGWNTAPVVLKRETGSCSEYTFSFIALCRAAGLPARYVGAVVVRGDDASYDDVFHRWPEIYLPNYGWVPIDPQAGDKPSPRARAEAIGSLPNRFLITTQGAGDSQYMGWYYNSYETYTADPQVMVNIETFAEWEPLEEKKQLGLK